MLEVYNENVYDLLAAIPKGQSAAKSNVKILSDGIGNFIPHGNASTFIVNFSTDFIILDDIFQEMLRSTSITWPKRMRS
jgi:hypothetical protein